MREQRPDHLLRVNTTRLALPCLAVRREARRIQDDRLVPFRFQAARQPKPFETGFVATQNPNRGSGLFQGIFTMPLDQRDQAARIRSFQGVKTDLSRAGRLDADDPTLSAEFNRNLDRDILQNDRSSDIVMKRHSRFSY